MNHELAKKIEQALQSAQRAHSPSAADRARVHAALQRALSVAPDTLEVSGVEHSPAASGASVSAASGLAPLLKLSLLGGVLFGVAGLGFWALGSAPSPRESVLLARGPARFDERPVAALQPATAARSEVAPQAQHGSPPPTPLASPGAALQQFEPASIEPAGSAPPSTSRKSAQRPARSEAAPAPHPAALAPAAAESSSAARESQPEPPRPATWPAELELMRRALAALNAGSTSTALALLDEHAARHPHGMLRAERLGLRVVALCASGQRSEGERERRAFLREFGELPIARRVRGACSGSEH
jgi:hypothetical protein